MGARVDSATIIGVEAHPVQVETEIIGSLRRFALVGLPDGVLREAKDRVRCALENSGFSFPHGEVIVNLAPAALPKRGSGFDLAIALSILASIKEIPLEALVSCVAYAELNLDGGLKPVGGELAVAAHSALAKRSTLFCSEFGAQSACCVSGIDVYGIRHLSQLVAHLRGSNTLVPRAQSEYQVSQESKGPTLADVVGQEHAKRALEITAAGAHNLLMIGPPGSGKSMLAQRIPSLLPPLALAESIEVAAIHSVSKCSNESGSAIRFAPPYRAPHHSTSVAGLIGGGSVPQPGEITLAHRGVLFLDEIAELRRDALEALRMPLETKVITISRSQMHLEFPADCIVVGAMNPCPCGKFGSQSNACRCSEMQRRRYFDRLSGPIRDRFDLQLWVPNVPVSELQLANVEQQVAKRQARVILARRRQEERGVLNSNLQGTQLRKHCELDEEAKTLIARASQRYTLSARGYTRILRVARTIADLEQQERVLLEHVAEALAFRSTLPGT